MKTKSRKVMLCGLMIPLLPFAAPSAGAAPLYQWKFDGAVGTPFVTSGGGLLTANGAASFAATGVTGLAGDNALSVSNSYTGGVGAADSASTAPANVLTGVGTLNQFTVTMWVNLTAGDLANFPRLMELGNTATPDSGSNPGINMLVNNGNLEVGVNSYKASVAVGFSSGNWRFIAFSYDGTTTNPYFSTANNTLYAVNNNAVVLSGTTLNSVAVAGSTGLNSGVAPYTTAPGPAAISNAATVYFGNRADGQRGFTGLIDDVRIFNTQLTIAELEAIRLESSPPPPAGGTPSYWKGGVSGAWNAANWTSDLAGTSVSPLPTNGTAAATFAATSPGNLATTVLGANQNVKSLKFNTQSTAVGIGGTQNLTIGNAGITLDADAGTVNINTTGQVVLGVSQLWTNLSANPFTVASPISGAFTLTTVGPGVTVLSGSNTHTATIVNSGTLRMGNVLALGPVTSTVEVAGGSLDLNGLNPVFGGIIGGGVVTNTLDGTSTLTLAPADSTTFVAATALNDGGAGKILEVTKTGLGTQRISARGSYTGNLLVSEGTLNVSSTVNGGGNTSSVGNFQTPGRTLTVSPDATLRFISNDVLGNAGYDTSLLPEIILNGGTLDSLLYNVLGKVTLNGGTLTNASTQANPPYQGYQFKGDIDVTGVNGSTITTTTNHGNHLGTDTIFNVATGSSLVVSTALLDQSGNYANAVGGLTKTGPGTMTMSGVNTYTGLTILLEGKLILSTATSLSDTANFEVANTAVATLELNYVGTDNVADFIINGSSGGGGTYGAVGSGANHQFAWITGTGLIGTPVTDPYFTWIATYYPIPNDPDAAKTADPDKDGLTNLQEFAFNSLPNNGAASGKIRSRIETVGAAQALVTTFPVRTGAVFSGTAPALATLTADSLIYGVYGTNTLAAFDQNVSEIPESSAGLPVLDTGWSYRTFRLNGDVGGGTPRGPRGFLRVSVEATP